MSIPGVESARRRRAYQGRPLLDLSANGAPPARRRRPGSSPARQNHSREPLENHHSRRHCVDFHPTVLTHPRIITQSAGSVVDHTAVEQASGSLNADDRSTAKNILRREALRRSRSPMPRGGRLYWNDQHGAAMAARNRLDEKLRAAALVNRRRGALHNLHESSAWNEEEIMETSMRDWLAAWAPSFDDPHSGLDSNRNSESLKPKEGISKAAIGALHREIFAPKRKGMGNDFGKPRGAVSEQDDCPVCLERFTLGQTLICLPCKHRFHSDCLTPWLESHCQCPCCRAKITDKGLLKAPSLTGAVNHNVLQPGDDLVSWMTAIETGFRRFGFHSATP